MSSPADVTIKNFTKQSITTKVTRDYWVEGDGSSIDGKVIPSGEEEMYRVVAKTGHHGELDIDLIGGSASQVLGTFKINSIKDPHEPFRGEDEPSTKVYPNQDDISMCAMGYRTTPGDNDLRRIYLTVVQQ